MYNRANLRFYILRKIFRKFILLIGKENGLEIFNRKL